MAPVWDVWPGGEREGGQGGRGGSGVRERGRDKKAKEFQDLELSL